jgi:hypothetical protein
VVVVAGEDLEVEVALVDAQICYPSGELPPLTDGPLWPNNAEIRAKIYSLATARVLHGTSAGSRLVDEAEADAEQRAPEDGHGHVGDRRGPRTGRARGTP